MECIIKENNLEGGVFFYYFHLIQFDYYFDYFVAFLYYTPYFFFGYLTQKGVGIVLESQNITTTQKKNK